MRKKISFDFDGCLTREDVQMMARITVKEGKHDVFVTTARWPDPMMHLWEPGASNEDMYKILDSVGISRTNIIFTNSGTKADFLVRAGVDIHLDDNKDQLFWANLAGVKTVDVTLDDWIHNYGKYYRAPIHDIKLLICGEGRHGKDTMAELLQEYLGLEATSSSWVAADLFFNTYKDVYNYKTIDECYADRINHRKEWFDFITAYNQTDRTRLTRKILETSNIYVGLRNPEEFEEAKHLFDATIWVDASKRLPAEGKDSNGITADMCDIIITNNTTLEDFKSKVKAFASTLRLDKTKIF